jgi:nucleotide-binding universal stress UspA family protein
MFRHLLVPLDLGPPGGRVLETARALAERDGARVTLLHVIQQIEDIPQSEVRRFYASLERTAEQKMTPTARKFARAGLAVRAVVLIGNPAGEIIRFAASSGVDLIVMRSHRVDPTGGARGWGTTSYKVGILCQCPVMLVK